MLKLLPIFALSFAPAVLPGAAGRPPIDEAEELFRRRVTPEVAVVRDAAPAVVYIQTDGSLRARDVFGRVYAQRFNGSGSGVVIQKDGFIITNYHVVKDSKTITVSFDKKYDSVDYRATLVSYVQQEDLALLKIERTAAGDKPFPTIPMGTSSDLMLGERVVAIGNPYGQTHTVTQGIISGLHRNIQIPNSNLAFDDLIQTDATINPGNSGGPLLNINGELIGINSAMNMQAENIGFSIPVDRVKKVLAENLLAADSAPTWLGFEVEGRDHVQVGQVVPGSPAWQAGLQPGDCIVAFAGQRVATHEEYRMARVGIPPTRDVELKIERDGETRAVKLKPWDKSDGILYQHLGIKARTVTTARDSFVQITDVRADSAAAELGLRTGDVIDAVQPQLGRRAQAWRLQAREDLSNLVAQLEAGTRLDVEIYRDQDRGTVYRGTLTIE